MKTPRLLAVLFVLGVGLFLRGRFAAEKGLWLDECGTVWASRGQDLAECVHRVHAVQGQSPLYYVVVRETAALLGESDLSVRLPGIVAGALVPLLGYLGASRAFGRRAGAAALLLLALDPRLVHDAEWARPYPLAELGALVSFYGLVRALEKGEARWRLAAWGGAVFAVYAHFIFAPILAALFVAAFLGKGGAYSPRMLLFDLALATAALVPAARQMSAVAARRSELAWVSGFHLAVIGAILPWRVRVFAIVGAILGRRELMHRPLVFVLAAGALSAGMLLALYLMGSNLVDERYLALGATLVPLASAWAIASLPRPVAASALAVVSVLAVRDYDERFLAWRQEWREAAALVRELAPAPDEPVLLWSGFYEARLALEPGRLTPELASFLASPLDDQPGHPETLRRYFPLCSGVDPTVPGLAAYFESVLAPALENAPRFFLVAGPHYGPDFDKWLAARFPGKFERASRSGVFRAPAVVFVYRRR